MQRRFAAAGAKTLAVTGTVTYRGQPVEGARVMFIPQNSRPASGLTDAQGRFTPCSVFAPDDGAVLGEHVVCIAKAIPDPNDKSGSPYRKSRSLLPEGYATPMKSPLKALVTAEGPNDFRFDLTD